MEIRSNVNAAGGGNERSETEFSAELSLRPEEQATTVHLVTPQYLSRLISLCPTTLTRDKGPPCHTAVFVQAEVTLSHHPHTRQSVHSKNSQTAIFTNTFKNSYQHFYFFVYHQLPVGLSFWEANTVTYKYFLCITQNDCLSIYTF